MFRGHTCESWSIARPTNGTIGAFRVSRWVKAIKVGEEFTYTDADTFEVSVSVESDADAYYIAIMTFDLGKGDVDGDGFVTASDILRMKRYLVGVQGNIVFDVDGAWQIADASPENRFYLFLWDVNVDANRDTRDVYVVRSALATGYGYEIRSDVTVNGAYYTREIIVAPIDTAFDGETQTVADAASFSAALGAGKRIGLVSDIEIVGSDPVVIETSKDILIDLGGKTLKVGQFTLHSEGKITVRNGVIDPENAFTMEAEGGVYCEGLRKAAGEEIEDENGERQSLSIEA